MDGATRPKWSHTSTRRGAKYCNKYVCLCVCPHAYLRNRMAEIHQFLCMLTACRTGAVFLWRRWNMTCIPTSGFVDDVTFTFSQNELYGASHVLLIDQSETSETTASIPTKFCWTIKITKYLYIVGWSLLSKLSRSEIILSSSVDRQTTRSSSMSGSSLDRSHREILQYTVM